MGYQVKLPIFEGPLDLLLHLIRENEIDIYNIPIALITQQYLDYLDCAQKIDLDLTSDFIVMACTLLAIKAKMLLPQSVVEIAEEEMAVDPREELVQRLLAYREYQEKAKIFQQLGEKQAQHFAREIDEKKLLQEFPPLNPLGNITWEDLQNAFSRVLCDNEKNMEIVSLAREEITVQKKTAHILDLLQKKPQGISFNRLIARTQTKEEVIVTFLALLELVRLERVSLRQKSLFTDIYVFLTMSGKGGNTDVYSFS